MKTMEKIKTENLAMEIKAAISDLFVAQVTAGQSEIFLQFENGQKFVVTVKEN